VANNGGGTDVGYSTERLAFDVDAMLVWSPWSHAGLTIGPTAAIPMSGSTTSDALNTKSVDQSILLVGLNAGLPANF
jgi:hypothetical protein